MPVWLRTFTFNKLKEYYDKQNEEAEKQNDMMANKGKQEISKPNIAPQAKPDYIARAPKK
jgi:hypothetical protein